MVDILKKYLILETVEQDLTDAINNQKTVSVFYKGNKSGPKGPLSRDDADFTDHGIRYVIPVALGLHRKSGAVVMRGLVKKGVHTKNSDGSVKRNRPTEWHMFRVDRITSIHPHEDANSVGALESTAGGNLYRKDDKDMSLIYAQYGDDKPLTNEPEQVPVDTPSTPIAPDVPDVENKPTEMPPEISAEPEGMALPQRNRDNVEIKEPEIPIEPEEEIEPEVEDQPINEWLIWLNKVINN